MDNNSNTREVILTTVFVTFKPDGTYSVWSHQTWFVPHHDDIRQIEIFKRGWHRVKLVVAGRSVINIHEWGAWLIAALIDKDETVWRNIALNDNAGL